MESQGQLSSPSGSGVSREEVGERVGVAESEEVRQLQGEIKYLKLWVERQEADMGGMRKKEERLMREYGHRGNRIQELEHTVGLYQEDAQRRNQHILAMEERLKRTEDLLATRSAELAGTNPFLSTTDRLSEAEVFGIVRDLNETIYQVAVDLTEEWEKLESPHANPMYIDPTSQPCIPVLIQLTRNRDSMGLTLLLQSCLCSRMVSMTSSWGYHQELAVLESIHQHLSASGEQCCRRQVVYDPHIVEGQAISARWRSLAHSHLSLPPPDPTLLIEELTSVLGHTRSFSSTQHSADFVRAVALEGIEQIIRHAIRLESAFKVEVTSSDMSLLFEAPGTTFDDAKMTDDNGSGGVSVPGRQDRIAGTTEVGVEKSICKAGERHRTEILLKTKVVLERDVMATS